MVTTAIFMFSRDSTKFYENPKILSTKIAMDKDGSAKKDFWFPKTVFEKYKKYS